MGQIKIKGSAKREFKAEAMEITISVSTKGETPALAINKGKKKPKGFYSCWLTSDLIYQKLQ